MSNLTVYKPRLPMPATEAVDAEQWRVLTEAIFPNALTPEAVMMAVSYCRARNLDVFKRPVHIVPVYSKSLKRMVETVWPGISEVLTTAHRTGQFAGMDEPKWGAEVTENFPAFTDDYGNTTPAMTLDYPEWCSVTVYRLVRGVKCAFTEPVYWREAYAKRGKSTAPNDMWTKRPRGQLLKCAKAASIRAAFPEENIGPTAEEMDGQTIDYEVPNASVVAASAAGINLSRQGQPALGSDVDALRDRSKIEVIGPRGGRRFVNSEAEAYEAIRVSIPRCTTEEGLDNLLLNEGLLNSNEEIAVEIVAAIEARREAITTPAPEPRGHIDPETGEVCGAEWEAETLAAIRDTKDPSALEEIERGLGMQAMVEADPAMAGRLSRAIVARSTTLRDKGNGR